MAIRDGMPILLIAAALGAASGSAPARAQTAAAELDALAEASQDVEAGVALARSQAQSGDLTEALATVERVLLAHPEADEARFIHVGLLCRADDPAGARSEIDQFAGRQIPDEFWAEIIAACGAMPRPEPAATNSGAESGR
jgi:Flp pilus assembly protein TadD